MSRRTKTSRIRRRRLRRRNELAGSQRNTKLTRLARRAEAHELTLSRQAARDAASYLRNETVGGLIMLAAAILALILANSGARQWYASVLGTRLGPAPLHLDLTVAQWASDGLLAVFFFVVGLELKRELVIGQLRSVRLAMLPVFAALGGMAVPGLIAFAITHGAPGAQKAWAVPLATDIAFAVAVLAVAASGLSSTVRVFLLSVAVVDDLGAILIIAVVFTSGIDVASALIALGLLILYWLLQYFRIQGTWSALLYVPIGLATWYFVHHAGIHATIAGVALGLLTRVKKTSDERQSPAMRLEHRIQPFSASVVVPLFALCAAGVTIDGAALRHLVSDPIAIGIVLGLVLGKPIGLLLGSGLSVVTRLARLPDGLRWPDIASIGLIAGIGFTVSLLLAELSFADEGRIGLTKASVLAASLIASLVGGTALHLYSRRAGKGDPVEADQATG